MEIFIVGHHVVVVWVSRRTKGTKLATTILDWPLMIVHAEWYWFEFHDDFWGSISYSTPDPAQSPVFEPQQNHQAIAVTLLTHSNQPISVRWKSLHRFDMTHARRSLKTQKAWCVELVTLCHTSVNIFWHPRLSEIFNVRTYSITLYWW